jgi:hypothetical protein
MRAKRAWRSQGCEAAGVSEANLPEGQFLLTNSTKRILLFKFL